MILDYVDGSKAFVLRVPRGEADIRPLMMEHGLDLSTSDSTAAEAVLFTREPYAAVTFFKYATPAAKQMLKGLADQISLSWKADSGRRFRMPKDKELWDYQKGTLEYALDRSHCLIGDEPGLGKSPMALVYCNEVEADRVLIICPAAIRLQWARYVSEWSTTPWTRSVHCVLNGRHGIHPTANFTIISYDLARTEGLGKALAANKYDVLILDEAHALKTIDSKRTRAICGGGDDRQFEPIMEQCSRVLALTGTPLPNRPREAYTLARSLCFESIDWMSEARFSERFNPSMTRYDDQGQMLYVDERTGRHAELQNRLRANFMVRHLKRDVAPQLKLPVYDLVYAEESNAIRQALAAENLLGIDPDQLTGADALLLGHISVVRRQMGVAMAPAAVDYVRMLLDGGEDKLVVFGWHTEVLDILQAGLQKSGVVRVDGSTTAKQRELNINKFIRDRSCKVIIGNLLSLGTGVDGLQHVCNHALIAEPDWVPGNNIQAFDRLNRTGQTRTVQCDIMVAQNSFAERILAAAIRKLDITTKALDTQW
jgi:SNF2 family DNA or RNA helicase